MFNIEAFNTKTNEVLSIIGTDSSKVEADKRAKLLNKNNTKSSVRFKVSEVK